jgi:hypothetical protein
LAIGEFSLATVAEGKTIKRAAIPIMVNNSLLSEVYCQNRLTPNKSRGNLLLLYGMIYARWHRKLTES